MRNSQAMKLLETIKCKDGKMYNLSFHQFRFDLARKEYFNCLDKVDLARSLQIPPEFQKGLFRCRVSYSEKIEKIEFLPHQYKKVETLKLVADDSIDYKYKYSDRKHLNNLFAQRDDCDDILIVKNGCITDTLTANPIFFDGEKWWTPDTPLLSGTQRSKLLQEEKIFECRIRPGDLTKYLKVGLINALQDMEEMPVINVQNIKK